jgi:hypothetical protein
MQGTLVMLVALSGLGCHNRGCDIAYAPPTYSSCFGVGLGCYADLYPGPVTPACYAGCYGGGYSGCYGGGFSSCYAGCYGGCYGGGCYGGWFGSCYGGGWGGCYGGKHHRGCGGGLFSCFHRKRCSYCSGYDYAAPSCYASAYAPAVFGSALGMSYGPFTSGQSMAVPSKQWGGSTMQGTTTAPPVPSEVAPPVAPTPVTPRAATPPATPSMDTPPPPPAPAAPTAPRANPPAT